VPPEETAAKFDRIVHPMFEAVEVARKFSIILRASRDLLLPRLISGDLSVSSAERELKDAA
jgi:type I restriction enzyme, S subunit